MAKRPSLVAQPHLYIGDTTGRPLDGGKIYFGQVNKDPELYPINIFYDEGLSIPALQPVRTKGGFMYANGNMVKIYAAETRYSVKALDSYSRQVFYDTQMDIHVLDEGRVVVKDFGAIGDGLSHKLSERFTTLADAKAVYPHAVSLNDEIDWCALQAFLNRVLNSKDTTTQFDWTGTYTVNRKLSLIVTKPEHLIRTITGDLSLVIGTNFAVTDDRVMTFHGRGINLSGTTIEFSINRNIKYGIVCGSKNIDGGSTLINFGLKLGSLFIGGALIDNVRFTEGSMYNSIDFYRGGGCGAGYNKHGVDTEFFYPANVITHTNNAYADAHYNTSHLFVNVLPIPDINESPVYVHYNNQIARVMEIDVAAKKLVTYPLITKPASVGTLHYIWGANISTFGADSAGIHIKQMTTFGSGVGIFHGASYPCQIDYFCSEFSAIAILDEALVGGVSIDTAYFEGDTWQWVKKSDGRPYSGSSNIRYATGVEIDKWADISTSNDENGVQYFAYAGTQGLVTYEKGMYHSQTHGKMPNNIIRNNASNGFGVDFNKPHTTKVYRADSQNVGFMDINPTLNRLFAYDSQEFIFIGSGENQAPTGSFTFPAPTGYTVNNTSSVTFTGFSSAAHFTFFLNVATKNIQVACSTQTQGAQGGASLSPTAIIPANISNVSTLPVDTYYWFFAGTGVGGLPPATTGAVETGTIKTRYSYAKAGEGHRITQEVHYPEIKERWERMYSSATGNYDAWVLLDYVVKKGASGQRPANPKIGTRYFDTTLAAAGKPISYTGSSWVDGLGAVV